MKLAVNYTKILADLVAAKALIDTPEKWLKGQLSNGTVTFKSPDATCFCAFGAAARVSGSLALAGNMMGLLDSCVPTTYVEQPGLEIGEEGMPPVISRRDAVKYNDDPNTTHDDIMALWDRAIAKAKAFIVRDNLIAAKAKIATPEQWTQKVYARDAEGGTVPPLAENAACYCSIGALRTQLPPDINKIVKSREVVLLTEVLKEMGYDGIVSFNDHWQRKHEEVLAVFDEAILRATKEAQAI